MITLDGVSFTYPGDRAPTLADIDLHLPSGELTVIVGATGSGKSTLLRLMNGQAPHLTGGRLTGRVLINGRDTRTSPPRELADTVGVVPQDPRSSFVTDVLEDELAYGMEQLGMPPATMRRRVEEALDLLGLTELRARPLSTLSGGQRQRAAIAAALTPGPTVLLLDEPTSALDPGAAEDVLAALRRLVDDLGVTVVLAEHRLERVLGSADTAVVLDPPTPVRIGPPAEVMSHTDLVPPVMALGRCVGWSPPPLTVRDARRLAPALARRLTGASAAPRTPQGDATASGRPPTPREPSAELHEVTVAYGRLTALSRVTLQIRTGDVLALMGRNGSGKTTLLHTLVGLRSPVRGRVSVGGVDPSKLTGRRLLRQVGLVPQEPTDLLIASSVDQECTAADADAAASAGTTRSLLDRLAPGITGSTHPRDLSEGQRLCCALAVILAATPSLVLLDEPTRGLDYRAKASLVTELGRLGARGTTIVLATHDVELAAEVATRVVILAGGEVVADGPSVDVLADSPMFAPQVAKILAPHRWLTVSEVRRALIEHPEGVR